MRDVGAVARETAERCRGDGSAAGDAEEPRGARFAATAAGGTAADRAGR